MRFLSLLFMSLCPQGRGVSQRNDLNLLTATDWLTTVCVIWFDEERFIEKKYYQQNSPPFSNPCLAGCTSMKNISHKILIQILECMSKNTLSFHLNIYLTNNNCSSGSRRSFRGLIRLLSRSGRFQSKVQVG